MQLKALLPAILLLLTTYQGKAQNESTTVNSAKESFNLHSINGLQNISRIDSIINFSKTFLGKPYRGGSSGPNSFDCSGFTSFVFSNFGIKLGRSSRDQAEQLPTISNDDIQPGDLVFFNGHHRGSRIGHVGLVVEKKENGEFSFIHSASSSGISISNSTANYYQRRFIKAGRVFNTDSLLARAVSTSVVKTNEIEPVKMEDLNTAMDNNPVYENVAVTKKIPAKYHVVKSGETLSSIAKKYGVTVSQLRKQNKMSSDFLSLKQRIKVAESRETQVYEKVLAKHQPKAHQDSVQHKTDIAHETSTNNKMEHVVAKGETLFSIAKKYHMTVDELKKLNQTGKGHIIPGQKLLVVNTENNTEEHLADIAPVQTPVKEKKHKQQTHTVKSGETMSEIADKYNCSVAQIKNWNHKKNTKINAGEKLKINA